jgi:hypothetical protein
VHAITLLASMDSDCLARRTRDECTDSPAVNHRPDIDISAVDAENALMTAVPQLITLLGVLIGALTTFTVTTWTERLKWQRTIETR